MRPVFKIAILFLFWTQGLWAAQIQLNGGARTYPTTGSLEFQAKEDFRIWGEKKEKSIFYGFSQARISATVTGTAEIGLNLYPISILELSYSASQTSRYYQLRKFECEIQVCKGIVTRDRLGVRLLLGHEFEMGTLFIVPAYQKILSRHVDQSKPLADEQETLIANPGGDETQVSSVMLGLKKQDEVLGLTYRRSDLKNSKSSSDAAYLIFRHKPEVLTYTYGIGTYRSDLNASGFSALFAIQWSLGESMSLF